MRYTSGLAAIAALVARVVADDAPMAENTSNGMTFAATLPNKGGVTGSFVGSPSPNQQGSNIQLSLFDIPEGGNLSYGITANKIQGSDCSTGGGLLNPFGGATGADCTEDNKAACAIGDLSGKHGAAVQATGGAGTGYFTINIVDQYLSTDKSSDNFFGNKAIIIMDQNGTPLNCKNFINQQKASADAANDAAEASQSASASAAANSGFATPTSDSASQASESAAAEESGNGAARTATGFGAAAGVLAAFLL